MSEHDAPLSVTERIVFSGRVQGVGFRATTRRFARPFPVLGYVRNLPDGTVELVIRGTETAINDVLARITSLFRDNLAKVNRARIESDEPLSHFEIRY